jgi:hypothetical protein
MGHAVPVRQEGRQRRRAAAVFVAAVLLVPVFGCRTADFEPQADRPSPRKALDWLAAHQNADGSWGKSPDHQVLLTSLVTLAFYQHGESPLSEKYSETIQRAMERLLVMADAAKDQPEADPTFPSHVVLLYSLLFTDGMTGLPAFRKPIERLLPVLTATPCTPWHIGVRACLDGYCKYHKPDDMPAGIPQKMLAELPGKPGCAEPPLVFRYEAVPVAECKELEPPLDLPANWRDEPWPLVCVMAMTDVLEGRLHLPGDRGRDWRTWWRTWEEIVELEQARDGSFRAARLGVAGAAEFASFRGEDTTIYTTAMVLFAMPQYRCYYASDGILRLHLSRRGSPAMVPHSGRPALPDFVSRLPRRAAASPSPAPPKPPPSGKTDDWRL